MPTKIPTYAPSWHRMATLDKERCIIFNHIHNPTGLRLGNRILKMRLRANAIKDYYPPKFQFTPRLLSRLFPGFSYEDEHRMRKEEMIEARKRRGKGPPAKMSKADFMKEQARLEERKLKAEAQRMKSTLGKTA